MAFPEREKHKTIFGSKMLTVGWTDMGQVIGEDYIRNDEWYEEFPSHMICGRRLHVGKDSEGKIFRFCPLCLVKVDSPQLGQVRN